MNMKKRISKRFFINQWRSSFGLVILSRIGLMVSVLSKNIFLVWIGLELNMFGVIPFLIKRRENTNSTIFLSKREIKSTFYYFFVQVIGRIFLISGAILRKWYTISIIGLMIKLGLPPFFWWVVPVLSRIDWLSIGLLRTVQKIPGIVLLRLIFDISIDIRLFISLIGMFFSCIGIKTSYKNLKKLIAWSSVNNMSLLLLLLIVKKRLGWIYYIVYSRLVVLFCFMVNSPFKKGNIKVYRFLLLVFSGTPPMIGFIMKIYFMSRLYLLDLNLIALKVWIPLAPHFLNSWKIIIIILLLIILQRIGYIKGFINLNSDQSSRVKIIWKKNYSWALEITLYLRCIIAIWY